MKSDNGPLIILTWSPTIMGGSELRIPCGLHRLLIVSIAASQMGKYLPSKEINFATPRRVDAFPWNLL